MQKYHISRVEISLLGILVELYLLEIKIRIVNISHSDMKFSHVFERLVCCELRV